MPEFNLLEKSMNTMKNIPNYSLWIRATAKYDSQMPAESAKSRQFTSLHFVGEGPSVVEAGDDVEHGVPQSSRAKVNPGAGVVLWAATGRAVKAAAQVRAMARERERESLNQPRTIGPMPGTRRPVRH